MSVLDVACGPGYVSAAVRKLSAIPTGIDFSEKMVATAKRMFPDISFLQGAAQALPFDDASYDRVWLTSACFILRNRKKRVGKLSVY